VQNLRKTYRQDLQTPSNPEGQRGEERSDYRMLQDVFEAGSHAIFRERVSQDDPGRAVEYRYNARLSDVDQEQKRGFQGPEKQEIAGQVKNNMQ
jgi:hypothetical protein